MVSILISGGKKSLRGAETITEAAEFMGVLELELQSEITHTPHLMCLHRKAKGFLNL